MKRPSKAERKAAVAEWNDPSAVDRFLAGLDHPLKPTLEAVRDAILGADPRITEGIKWNAPSFYCNGWFATTNVRGKDVVTVVFHLGAKVKDNSTAGVKIKDDSGLLKWAANERALAQFRGLDDFNAKRSALESVVRQWVSQMSV